MYHLDFPPLKAGSASYPSQFNNTHSSGSRPPGPGHWPNSDRATQQLRGKRVLLVEDEATVAFDLEYALIDRGAKVLGPVGTLDETLALIESTNQISAAILDVRISGQAVFPAAKLLNKREVPFIFHTGHSVKNEIAEYFPAATVCVKPQRVDQLLETLAGFFVK